MSGLYLSSGTAEVHVVSNGVEAVINTLNHSVSLNAHGQTIINVRATSKQETAIVTMRLMPSWLGWLLGERVTVKVRRRPSG